MGLFSFFSKNKQDRATEDSGRFYSKDDDAALGERARSKRATNAGAGAGAVPGRRTAADPMLPEKKRARRRLVGAIALALAAAVGLPMLLDSSPKPLAGDIAIQIPAKDKAAPLPVPGAPASAPAGEKSVAAEDSLNPGEEIVPAPAKATAPAAAAPAVVAEAKAERKLEVPKPEHKEAKPEHKDTPKAAKESAAEHRLAEKEKADRERAEKDRAEKEKAEKDRAARDKAEKAAAAKARSEDKPAKPAHDEARALAILEGKAAEKRAGQPAAEAASQKFALQVGAMSSQEKAAELQARLREAGISSYTQKSGELIKVKVGPLTKEELEKVRAKLGRIGLSGFSTPA